VEADAATALLREREYCDVCSLGDDWSGVSGADVVVLLGEVEPAVAPLTTRAPDAIVLVAGDPQGARVAGLLDATLFPRQRVIGIAGVHETASLHERIASATGSSVRDVTGVLVGGDDGVAVVRSTLTVAGIPLAAGEVDALLEGQVFSNGRSPAATALAIRDLADTIVLDRHRIISVTACCRGELGVEKGTACVPARIGRNGIEEIVELDLTADERAAIAPAAS
jgi:malate dehydrogenase